MNTSTLAPALWAALAISLATQTNAQPASSAIPPPSKAASGAPSWLDYRIPKSFEIGTELTQRALERGAAPFLRRGQEIAEGLADAPWSPTPPFALDLHTPVGNTLIGAGKVLKWGGIGMTGYSLAQDVREADAAVRRGDMRGFDAKVGDLTATAACAHPLLGGPCLASAIAGEVIGVDPVNWMLKKTGEANSHTARIGCGGTGNPMADYMMEGSDECINNRKQEWEDRAAQARADRQAEMARIAASNAAQAQAKQDALDAYRATISTPVQEPNPSGIQVFLDTMNQGLIQQQQQLNRSIAPTLAPRSTPLTSPPLGAYVPPISGVPVSEPRTPVASCRPAKTLDPKTGCHPGHDEKGHPGGCKCG